MRIVVHDYSGHPGQVSLSRSLARRGHTVIHQYCPSYPTGNGAVEALPDDPDGFSVEGVALTQSFARYTIVRRIRQEIQYGTLAARAIRQHNPDVALLSNIPLLSLLIAASALRRYRIPFVFWQQDVYSAAIGLAATRRLKAIGTFIGWIAARVERHIARQSKSVVPIDESFRPVLSAWGVAESHIHVIPNWAPIAELPQRSRDNDWAKAQGLGDVPVVMYTGTLGLKHDPMLLADAAAALGDDARVVVISEGMGRAVLEEARTTRALANLELLDFQPYDALPDVMASADVLVALLEPEASVYSVPSKVLTYLCSGRPIVGVIPSENSVARVIHEADAGRLVTPGDSDGLATTLSALLADDALRSTLGANARTYAEKTFDPDAVATHFEDVLTTAVS